MRFLSGTLIILSLIILASCSQQTYDNVTDYGVCRHLATKPPHNIHNGAMIEQKKKRNLNCKQYHDRIDEEETNRRIAKSSSRRNTNKFEMPKRTLCDSYGTQISCRTY